MNNASQWIGEKVREVMTAISDRSFSHSSKFMLLADRVLAGAALLKDLVWGFACPLHCGSSGIPWFVSGALVGFFLGIGLTLGTLWICFSLQPPAPFRPCPGFGHFPAPRASSGLRQRTRLSGYLPFDEQWAPGQT